MAKILYLEDQTWQVLGTVITYLEKGLKHEVKLVNTVSDAETELTSDVYDVIIVDIMMNQIGAIRFEESSFRLIQEILDNAFTDFGNSSETPIVIASGVWDATVTDKGEQRSTVRDLAQSFGIPQDNYLFKPFSADEIQRTLDTILAKGAVE